MSEDHESEDRESESEAALPPVDKGFYLGDGLYVKFDGFNLILSAPRENGVHWVGLEPQVWQSLLKWLREYPRLLSHFNGDPSAKRA